MSQTNVTENFVCHKGIINNESLQAEKKWRKDKQVDYGV